MAHTTGSIIKLHAESEVWEAGENVAKRKSETER